VRRVRSAVASDSRQSSPSVFVIRRAVTTHSPISAPPERVYARALTPIA
jgi:hypothetical protein